MQSARRRHAIAQLDVLDLVHAEALRQYVGVLAAYRGAFRSLYDRDPEGWDYAALADCEGEDERVMRVAGIS